MPKQDQRTGKMQKLAVALKGGRNDNRSPWMTPGTPDKSSTGFEEPTWHGVPLSRADNFFETFDTDRHPLMIPAYMACTDVANGDNWSAFMLGSTGNGKTHLAIAAMHLWAERHCGRGVDFWKVPDLLAFLRSKLNEGIRAEVGEALVDRYLSHYRHDKFLLVLDDLGTENPTDWACEKLYQILDSRADEKHPTIITSNARVAQIDGRIRSRFRAGLVACGGEDVRGHEKEMQ